jgi:hypothetical protein
VNPSDAMSEDEPQPKPKKKHGKAKVKSQAMYVALSYYYKKMSERYVIGSYRVTKVILRSSGMYNLYHHRYA